MAFPLILIPILVPLLAGTVLLLILRLKPDFGYFWISSVLTALVVWVGLLVLRWQAPLFFSMNLWQEIGFQVEFPYFLLDEYSWPYIFSLASLLTVVAITAPVRISQGSSPKSWAYTLVLGGLSMMGVLAANPLTLIMAWSGLDFIEMSYLLRRGRESETSRRAVTAFAVGLAGTFLAVWAMLESQSQGLPLSFDSMTPEASQFLALAAGVRLAVFPLLAVSRLEIPASAGLGSILRFASPGVSLVLLSRLPAVAVSPELSPVLFSLVIIACLYGSVMWFTAKDEICGRPYWILSFSALALACVLQGRPDVSPLWGSAMILGGGLLSLFRVRQVRLLFIPMVVFACLTGIPFTPVSGGWTGLWMEPFQISNAVFLTGTSLLLAGFLKHSFRQDETREEIDRWIQIIYPAGLINIPITFVLVGVWAIDHYGVQYSWIGPILATAMALIWLGINSWLSQDRPVQSLIRSIGTRTGSIISYVVELRWLLWIGNSLFPLTRKFILWLSGILEGDGGVLWALLILLLLITLIQPEVLP